MKVPKGMGLWPAFWLLPSDCSNAGCSGCGCYGGWASSGEIDIMEAANMMGVVSGRGAAGREAGEAVRRRVNGDGGACLSAASWLPGTTNSSASLISASKPTPPAGLQTKGTLHYGANWPANSYTTAEYSLPNGATFADDFHVFRLDWSAQQVGAGVCLVVCAWGDAKNLCSRRWWAAPPPPPPPHPGAHAPASCHMWFMPHATHCTCLMPQQMRWYVDGQLFSVQHSGNGTRSGWFSLGASPQGDPAAAPPLPGDAPFDKVRVPCQVK